MKPSIDDVLFILYTKRQAAKLLDDVNEALLLLKEQYGEGRFDYDLGELDPFKNDDLLQKGRYLKFEIVDNAKMLLEGKSFYTMAKAKPVSGTVSSLKRKPKSL